MEYFTISHVASAQQIRKRKAWDLFQVGKKWSKQQLNREHVPTRRHSLVPVPREL